MAEPCAFMFERSVISHKEPIGLPRSTAPDKKILVFVARDFEHFCHRYLVYRFAGLRSRLFRSTSMVVSFLVFSLTPGALQKLRLPTGLQKNWQLVEKSPPVGNGNEHWCNRLRRSKAAAPNLSSHVRIGKQRRSLKKATDRHYFEKIRFWLTTGQRSCLRTHCGTARLRRAWTWRHALAWTSRGSKRPAYRYAQHPEFRR